MNNRLYDAERRALSRAKVLMEEKIGRKLREKEYVYHIDGDVFNLDSSNLEVISPDDPRSIYYDDGKERSRFGVEVFP